MSTLLSARQSIGLPVVDQSDHVIGTAETWLIDTKTKSVEGLLIGRTARKAQGYVPLLCIDEITSGYVRIIKDLAEIPKKSQRIIGLPAKTTLPKFLVGFVSNCWFDATGQITMFDINQLVR